MKSLTDRRKRGEPKLRKEKVAGKGEQRVGVLKSIPEDRSKDISN